MLKQIATILTASIIATPVLAEVNIYSSRNPQLIDPILEAFTAETGIKTNIVFIKDGLIERLKAEGQRSPADLVLTTDISNLNAIVEAGVTQAVTSDVINANIPATFRDPEGNWFGLTSRARVIYASNERVAEVEVATYEDLTDPKWEGRICTRSGSHNYNVGLLSAVVAHHGEEAAEQWLTGLKANLARKPQGNDRAQIKAIWAGVCDIAIGNTYYMGAMLQNEEQQAWANSVTIQFPILGDNGVHVNLSGMAMTKSSSNDEDTLRLMEFLTSEAAQAMYAELNFEYPLLETAQTSELVQSWGDFTPDSTPLVDIAKLRNTALKIVDRVNFNE
ncbi:iron ABC transporter substrate-binding protein [Rhodobacterales bacterium 52_120_T64]|nr:iron ABC transporter substrate-binding protein [Rhodobacterales bacterium 52_120_T64]